MFKLMIVDDEPLERIALRKIAERNFFDTEILEDAKNGTEAIEKAELYRPDIILMDIRMPETSGLEAQKRIIQFLPNVRTIVLTAHSDFHYAQKALKEGVFDYLLKPVRPEDLIKSITNALESIYKPSLSKTDREETDKQSNDHLLKTALNYMKQNFKSELKLDTVANTIHLNPQYFSRIFKREFGVPFTEYVTKLRISEGKKLLIESEMPVYRIAAELGFSDAAYFSKVFYKFEMCTPIEYRKQSKNNVH